MEVVSKYQERVYKYNEACVFRKTKEAFGGLSNMASGFPIIVNGIHILSTEALYQACRFPHMPDVQRKIISERSPMTAKMVGKPFRDNSRSDWDSARTDIMYWCLRVKLAQNFLTFGQLLESTYNKPIVEDSSKDPFWGAMKDKEDEAILKGVNALGRLLMKLRQEYNEKRFDLFVIEPLHIPNFLLYGKPIEVIDERLNFIDTLYNHWGLTLPNILSNKPLYVSNNNYSIDSTDSMIVSEAVVEPMAEEQQPIAILDDVKAQSSESVAIPDPENLNAPKQGSTIEEKILSVFNGKPLTAKEILAKLHSDITTSKLTSILKKLNGIEVKHERPVNQYYLKMIASDTLPNSPQAKLFT